jgi:hypothetical protein
LPLTRARDRNERSNGKASRTIGSGLLDCPRRRRCLEGASSSPSWRSVLQSFWQAADRPHRFRFSTAPRSEGARRRSHATAVSAEGQRGRMTPVEQGQRGFVLLLAQLAFERESRPCACHVGKNGVHSRIGRAARHLPTFSGTFSTFDWRNHHVSPFRTGGGQRETSTGHRARHSAREGGCHSAPLSAPALQS